MRPIKFRVWDKRVNKMRYDFDIQKHIEDKNTKAYIPAGVNRNSVAMKYLSQYIGVDDSNGKEIYDGDIVKATEDDDSYISEVKYFDDQGYPAFDITPPDGYSYDSNVIMSVLANGKLEIIGNIYEGLETLEKD